MINVCIDVSYSCVMLYYFIEYAMKRKKWKTRGPKGHISCTWVQCATFLRNRPRWTFYAPGLKGPSGASSNWIIRLSVRPSVCPFVRLSVRNSVPLPNKVQYLKFGWWYSHQTWTVSSSMGFLTLYWHHMPLGVGWGQNVGLIDFCHIWLCCRRGHLCFTNTCLVCLLISPKNKLGRGRWDLASCQVSLGPLKFGSPIVIGLSVRPCVRPSVRPVRKKWLSPFYSTYWCYIHQTCTNCSSWHDLWYHVVVCVLGLHFTLEWPRLGRNG